MKHIVKFLSLLMAIFAMWVSLLHMSTVPRTRTWLDISEAKQFLKQREDDDGPD